MAAHGARCRLDGHACTLHDLTTRFDAELFRRFYHELLVPNFPLDDELVPWEETLAGPATLVLLLVLLLLAMTALHWAQKYVI